MSETKHNSLTAEDKIFNYLVGFFALASFCIFATTIAYFGVFSLPLSDLAAEASKNKDAQAIWGQFGEFIGGTLNQTFAFLSFAAPVATLALQIRQTEIAREGVLIARETAANEAKRNEILQAIHKVEKTIERLSGYRTGGSTVGQEIAYIVDKLADDRSTTFMRAYFSPAPWKQFQEIDQGLKFINGLIKDYIEVPRISPSFKASNALS